MPDQKIQPPPRKLRGTPRLERLRLAADARFDVKYRTAREVEHYEDKNSAIENEMREHFR